MKSPTAYYLLLLYVTLILKPLMPFVIDEWDHQFNEIEHVSIVHARYGSHHLEKELANSTADNNKNKDQNTTKTEDSIPFHLLAKVCKYDLVIDKSATQYFSLTLNKLPSVCISSQGQPPKFS
ncbi:MAG: hypothetical protein ABIO55_12220 [Ginsengibacter sp.]